MKISLIADAIYVIGDILNLGDGNIADAYNIIGAPQKIKTVGGQVYQGVYSGMSAGMRIFACTDIPNGKFVGFVGADRHGNYGPLCDMAHMAGIRADIACRLQRRDRIR